MSEIVRPPEERTDTAWRQRFASDVAYYLARQPRQLPSRYFYDPLGSALFEAVCRLPWYALARAEERLLRQRARDVFRNDAHPPILELGSGSGEKLAVLVDAAERRSQCGGRT